MDPEVKLSWSRLEAQQLPERDAAASTHDIQLASNPLYMQDGNALPWTHQQREQSELAPHHRHYQQHSPPPQGFNLRTVSSSLLNLSPSESLPPATPPAQGYYQHQQQQQHYAQLNPLMGDGGGILHSSNNGGNINATLSSGASSSASRSGSLFVSLPGEEKLAQASLVAQLNLLGHRLATLEDGAAAKSNISNQKGRSSSGTGGASASASKSKLRAPATATSAPSSAAAFAATLPVTPSTSDTADPALHAAASLDKNQHQQQHYHHQQQHRQQPQHYHHPSAAQYQYQQLHHPQSSSDAAAYPHAYGAAHHPHAYAYPQQQLQQHPQLAAASSLPALTPQGVAAQRSYSQLDSEEIRKVANLNLAEVLSSLDRLQAFLVSIVCSGRQIDFAELITQLREVVPSRLRLFSLKTLQVRPTSETAGHARQRALARARERDRARRRRAGPRRLSAARAGDAGGASAAARGELRRRGGGLQGEARRRPAGERGARGALGAPEHLL
eukprot:scaffold4317_cov323-Prasinococcus_capsulatus_cf.AAC.1